MAKPRKGKAAPIARIALVAGPLLVIAAVYFLFFKPNSQTTQFDETGLAQVAITSPVHGAQLPALEPVIVTASAIGPQPFTAAELWVNGELVAVQAGASGGETPLVAAFSWQPNEPGVYTLVVRGVVDGGAVASPEIAVEVVAAEARVEGEEQAADAAAFQPAVLAGYSAPELAQNDDASATNDAPADLPAPLELQVVALHFDETPDKSYCYRSFNGGAWQRWPQADFFVADANGNFAAGEQISLLPNGPFSDEQGDVQLDLECWGWFADVLDHLGSQEFIALDGELTPTFGEIDMEFEYTPDWSKIFAPPTVVTNVPAIQARITYDPAECGEHLPPNAQTELGQNLFCFPYPNFDNSVSGGLDPQPYLVWDFVIGPCGTLTQPADCVFYEDWLEFSGQAGTQMGFEIAEWDGFKWTKWQVTAPELFNFVIPPKECSYRRQFTVSMWSIVSGEKFMSLPSNVAELDCTEPQDSIGLEIFFESMTLPNNGDFEKELYGYFEVIPSVGAARYLNLAAWNFKAAICPDDDPDVDEPEFLYEINLQQEYGCPQYFIVGPHNLNTAYMCESLKKTTCSISEFDFANNVIELDLKESASFYVKVAIYQYWYDGSVQLVCTGVSGPMSNSLQGWAAHDYTEYSFDTDYCPDITFVVNTP